MPPRSARRAVYVVSGLQGFYEKIGIEDPPLQTPVIEAYCVLGLADRHPATRGTYRSVLRNVSGGKGPEPGTRFRGSRAQTPYSARERAELWSLARCQRSQFRAHSAMAVISLGLGAGLRSCEIIAARRGDVTCGRAAITISVKGDLARVVTVTGEAARWLRANSGEPAEEFLFHPEEADRSYPNFVNDFCRRVRRDAGAPYLSVARLRSSFVCEHLRTGTPLSEVLRVTGILEIESLIYYCRQVSTAPQTKAALRKALSAGG